MKADNLAAGGFLRMPRAWLHLEVSPGAKVLLMHLCAAANDVGESWYKFKDIAKIVGRSKAAVSGYVSELVEVGVIEIERQRTANGYYAHLLIRLVGWADLVRAWSEMTHRRRARRRESNPETPSLGHPPAERPVRSAERMSPTGTNESHTTKTWCVEPAVEAAVVEWSETDEEEWRHVKGGGNDLTFDRPPSDALLHRLVAAHRALDAKAGTAGRPALEAAARAALDRFCARRGLSAEAEVVANCASVLAEQAQTLAGVERAVGHLDTIWAPYWRRLSTPGQLRATLSGNEARKAILSEDERQLRTFALRALIAGRELENRLRDRGVLAARSRS